MFTPPGETVPRYLRVITLEEGEVVGFDRASRRLDLSMLETEALPLHSFLKRKT